MKSRTSKKSLEEENPKFLKQRMTNIGVEEKKKKGCCLENINTSALAFVKSEGPCPHHAQ